MDVSAEIVLSLSIPQHHDLLEAERMESQNWTDDSFEEILFAHEKEDERKREEARKIEEKRNREEEARKIEKARKRVEKKR